MDWKRLTVLSAAAAVSLVCFCKVVVPKAISYPIRAVRYNDYYQIIRDTLSEIPEGASVTASTFYTTFLSQRERLYDVRYSSPQHLLETQYVVLHVSADGDYKQYAQDGENNGFENLVRLLEENGYTQYRSVENVLVIYQKK